MIDFKKCQRAALGYAKIEVFDFDVNAAKGM